MSRNERYSPRERLSLPVTADTAEGVAVFIGTFSATTGINLIGVTETAEFEGGNLDNYATVALDGVFNLAISTTTAAAIGAPIYITSAGVLTPVSTSNLLFGHVVDTAKGTTAGEIVPVRIRKN